MISGLLGLGYTVTKGIVNGVRGFADLPLGIQESVKYDSSSRWIQTDCTINSGNSGGPLVDSFGTVVGINTWTWVEGENLFFALSAVHASDILKDKRSQPLTFKTAQQQFGKVRVPHTTFPVITILQTVKGSQLLSATRSFERIVACLRCNGAGRLLIRYKSGWTGAGTFRQPIFSSKIVTCQTCGGTRYNRRDRIVRGGTRLVERIAALDRQDERASQALEQAREVLKATVNINPSRLAQLLNDQAVKDLSTLNPRIGSPILVVGNLVLDRKFRGHTGHIRAVTMEGSETLVIFSEPQIVDAVESEYVIAGGVLAGFLYGAGGEVMPVIQDGFVVGQ